MYDVVVLSLAENGGGCPRTPVLSCVDALKASGALVDTVTAGSDEEIDAVLSRLDGPTRADGLTWPAESSAIRVRATW